MKEKSELRKKFIELRKHIPPQQKQEADHLIYEKLISHPKIINADTICCYVSYHEETDTHQFITWALSQGKNVCITKVSGQDLTLHQITDLNNCIPGFKGILEPADSTPIIQPTDVDVYVVLGLAFDAGGYRLGYGKGFTDRLLRDLNAYSIGISYTDQLVYELPRTDYDVPVREVITERVSYVCTATS